MSGETKKALLGINHSILFLCTSMFLGTGWSLVLFSFPIAPELTTENYYLYFIPQVTAATHVFTYLTMIMIACAFIMIVAEWKSYRRWFPIGVLLAVILATSLKMFFILPYNEQMEAGITDVAQLREVLTNWMNLNILGVGIWTVEWLCMMAYFFMKYMESPMTVKEDITTHRDARMAV